MTAGQMHAPARTRPVEIGLGASLGRHKRRVVEYTTWLVVASAPFMALAWVVSWAIDGAVAGEPVVLPALAMVAGLALMVFGAHWRTAQAIGALTTEVRADVDTRILSGLLALLVTDPRARPGGSSEFSRYGSLLAGVLMSFTQGLMGMAMGAAFAAGVVLVAPPLAPFVGLMLVVALLLGLVSGVLLTPAHRVMLVEGDEASRRLALALNAVRDVSAFGAHDMVVQQSSATFARDAEAGRRVVDRVALVSVVFGVVSLAIIVAAVHRMVDLREAGRLTDGQVVAAVVHLATAQFSLASLGEWAGKLIAANRSVLDRVSERTAVKPISRAGPPLGGPTLDLRGVTFAWGSTAIVSDLDLTVVPGDHLAIVGPSGVGKSTVASLMAGLIRPLRGEALLDGRDVATHPSGQSTIALVPQESYVFAGTLRENLTVLAPDSSDVDIERAAAAVGLERVVERVGGLDAEVSPATSGLSSGEQQLICLTRTWLSPASIIILDEGTCYLDPPAEAQAEEAFGSRPDTTLIVIAHRMSSARRADRILVMDGARVELGTHSELLRSNQLYADLCGAWEWPTDGAGESG